MSPRCGVLLGVSLAVSSLACRTQGSIGVPNRSTRTTALILAAGSKCGTDSQDIRAQVGASVEKFKSALETMGAETRVVRVNTRRGVFAEIERMTALPAIVIYSGHGMLVRNPSDMAHGPYLKRCPEDGVRCYSVGCFDEGEALTIDDLASAISRRVPKALLMVDACHSAYVDLRGLAGDFGVMSFAIQDLPTDTVGSTLLGTAFENLDVARMDANCDGEISDIEIFDGLIGVIDDRTNRAVPKYRRQMARNLGLLYPPKGERCLPHRPISSEPNESTVEEDPNEPGVGLIVHGPVPKDGLLRVKGKLYQPTDLIAVPCAEDVGQCFRRVRGGLNATQP